MKIIYDPDSLWHYGILGMKWGRRKSKAKSSGKKSSKSSKKKTANREKFLTDARKQKIKAVAKTTAKIAGSVAAASVLGYAGSIAFSEISRAFGDSSNNLSDHTNVSNQNISSNKQIFDTEKPVTSDLKNIRRNSDGKSEYVDVNIVDPTANRYGHAFTTEKLKDIKSQNDYEYNILLGRQWDSKEAEQKYADADRELYTREMIEKARKQLGLKK